MTDREVGELWREWGGWIYPVMTTGKMRDQITGVIRKLVDERKRLLAVANSDDVLGPSFPDDWTKRALRDFGIEEKEWQR